MGLRRCANGKMEKEAFTVTILKLQIGAAASRRPLSKARSDCISENTKKNANKLGPSGAAY